MINVLKCYSKENRNIENEAANLNYSDIAEIFLMINKITTKFKERLCQYICTRSYITSR